VPAFLALAIACGGCTFVSLAARVDEESRLMPCPPAAPQMPSRDESRDADARTHHFEHVLIIVFENQDYADVIADPYFASLARRGALFTDFHGLFHPSYSNYLAMISGRSFMSAFDCQRNLTAATIADRLLEANLTWRNYAEGYAGSGCVTSSSLPNSRYARKHVPFMSFESGRHDACANIVPGGKLADDLVTGLPTYMFYSPDLDHDGHDPTTDHPVGLIKASRWLERFLEPLLKDRRFTERTLTIVTFDESATLLLPDDNHIYTVFLGKMVKPGIYSHTYNHFNVLRTIEENFGLRPLAENDACAKKISDVWTPNGTGEILPLP
jgi:phosphoesterase family protein